MPGLVSQSASVRGLGNSPSLVKKALSIGIQYQNTALYSKGDPPPQLAHSHNDPDVLKNLLIRFYGYNEEDIVILKDDGKHVLPTRESILKAIDQMVKGAKAGDHFVFHFSGHGSQVENKGNGEHESDGMDEVIWPVDVVYDAEPDEVRSNFILDDELRERLVNELPPGTHLTVILDCCHSGSGVDLPFTESDGSGSEIWSPVKSPLERSAIDNLWRSPRTANPKGTPQPERKDRSSSSPDPEGHPNDINVTRFFRENFKLMQVRFDLNGRNKGKHVTSWAACADEEITYDGPEGGLLTHAFGHILTQHHSTKVQGEHHLTHRELLAALSTHLARTLKPAKHQSTEKMMCPRPILGSLHRIRDIYDVPFSF